MKTKLTILLCLLVQLLTAQTNYEKLKMIDEHSKAILIKKGWIRDPYIVLGPDNKYYLTGTTSNPNDSREQSDPFNTGLKGTSIVGQTVRLWRSNDLVNWDSLGVIYSLDETFKVLPKPKNNLLTPLWAPEIHWNEGHWMLVNCPQKYSTLAISKDKEFNGKWTLANPQEFKSHHDPSLFKDDNDKWYLIYGNTSIVLIKKDFSGLDGKPIRIDPSDRLIGHEGATLKKIGKKYVHFGTAWSTDQPRKGSYNLYYCTSDKIEGPYSERRFVGRFLGHGTPFQDKKGNWWCTAFFNGDVPPLSTKDIEKRNLSKTAQTINQMGTTLVPLEVKIQKDGDIFIRAIDKHYRNPGPDEVEKFKKE